MTAIAPTFAAPHQSDVDGMKILVAEDNVVFQKVLSGILGKWGYDVILAQDGEAALRVLMSDCAPQLAILDWMMPGLDGTEVCRRIRTRRNRLYIYILLMTAKTDRADLVVGLEAGVDDYVTKPFEPQELRLRLRAGVRVLESEERYRVMVETAPDAIITSDESGKIEFANNAAGKVFDVPCTDLLDQNIDAFMPDLPRHLPDQGPRSGDLHSSRPALDFVVNDKSGKERFLEVSLAECRRHGQRQITALIRDITERKRLELQLAQAQKLESIGTLAAGVAHEINTPIQFIGDNCEFLRGAFENTTQLLRRYEQAATAMASTPGSRMQLEAARKFAEEIDSEYIEDEIPRAISQSIEGVKRVSAIVSAMNIFSHSGSTAKTPTDLNRSIENTILVSRNEWKHVAEVVTDLDPRLPPIPCVPGEFNQVILNLIINAAHAITDAVKDRQDEHGQIVITTRDEDGWAYISIRDTGTGIPEHVRSRVFDQFFTTKEVGKGTGQGLAIAHSIIVERHQGTITFESKLGSGTIFIVRLPMTANHHCS